MNEMPSRSPTDQFIELMGLVTQAEGGTRISGRILGMLLVEGGAFTLQQMSERLQISKASASTNARFLAARGLIQLTTEPGSRQDFYEMVPDPYRHMMSTIGASMRATATKIAQVEAKFPDQQADAKRRVQHLEEFYRLSADFIDDWAKRLPRADR